MDVRESLRSVGGGSVSSDDQQEMDEASPPRSEGNLGEQDLPDLVQDLNRRLWTGVLILGRTAVEVRLSLKDGRMVFASSSDPDGRLGTLLMRRGALSLRPHLHTSKANTPGKRLATLPLRH